MIVLIQFVLLIVILVMIYDIICKIIKHKRYIHLLPILISCLMMLTGMIPLGIVILVITIGVYYNKYEKTN